jgi:hypothetical protein
VNESSHEYAAIHRIIDFRVAPLVEIQGMFGLVWSTGSKIFEMHEQDADGAKRNRQSLLSTGISSSHGYCCLVYSGAGRKLQARQRIPLVHKRSNKPDIF